MARDRLSTLDDNILSSHILSKLSLRDAVRCSLLSRRWRWLWTSLPHLDFVSARCTEEVIDNILFFHSAELESLKILLFHSDKMAWKWINCASLKRVKEIRLQVKDCRFVDVPTSLFYCNYLVFLELSCLKFRQLPPHFCGFGYLITCSLRNVWIDNDMLEQLVAQCPLLENLKIFYCGGLDDLEISAVNLKDFEFAATDAPRLVTVNCAKLANVRVHDCCDTLRMQLNSCGALSFYVEDFTVLKCISITGSLRKIVLIQTRDMWQELHLTSVTVLNRFRDLEELIIEGEDKVAWDSYDIRNSILRLKKLKKVHVTLSRFDGFAILLVGCLLRSAPSLQTMTLTLPMCRQYIHEQRFLKQLVGLERSSRNASVLITEKHSHDCYDCEQTKSEIPRRQTE